MTNDIGALLAEARRHLEAVEQARSVEGRQASPTDEQRIQLAQAYALVAIATHLIEGAEAAPAASTNPIEVVWSGAKVRGRQW